MKAAGVLHCVSMNKLEASKHKKRCFTVPLIAMLKGSDFIVLFIIFILYINVSLMESPSLEPLTKSTYKLIKRAIFSALLLLVLSKKKKNLIKAGLHLSFWMS